MQATSIDRFLLGRKGDGLSLFFFLMLRLQDVSLDRYIGASDLFVASVKVSTSSILLAPPDHLHTVLFSRFHAPGKRPGDVRLVSIQMIMIRNLPGLWYINRSSYYSCCPAWSGHVGDQ